MRNISAEFLLTVTLSLALTEHYFEITNKSKMPRLLSPDLLYALALTAFSLLKSVDCFQLGAPDPDGRFKLIIEKAIGEHLKSPPKFTIANDLRFPNTISSEVYGARPLSESVPLKNFVPSRKVVPRKLIGQDEYPTEYWFHNKIHTFGNTNVFGGEIFVLLCNVWLLN